MTNNRGGKRKGAGRPKGSNNISAKLREAAQEHTHEALEVLVDIMRDTEDSNRLKAAEMILTRGHGAPRDISASQDIIGRFINDEISAISACLMLEAEGSRVPDTLRQYLDNEICILNHEPFEESFSLINKPPNQLPRS